MFFIFCNSILSGHSMLCPYLLGYRILHLSLFDYKHLNVGTYHGTSEKTTKIGDKTLIPFSADVAGHVPTIKMLFYSVSFHYCFDTWLTSHKIDVEFHWFF